MINVHQKLNCSVVRNYHREINPQDVFDVLAELAYLDQLVGHIILIFFSVTFSHS